MRVSGTQKIKKKKFCLESFLGIEDEEKRGNQIGEKSRVERMRR